MKGPKPLKHVKMNFRAEGSKSLPYKDADADVT